MSDTKRGPGAPTKSTDGEKRTPRRLTLTPTAVAGLDAEAARVGVSRSEVVERHGRELLAGGARDRRDAE